MVRISKLFRGYYGLATAIEGATTRSPQDARPDYYTRTREPGEASRPGGMLATKNRRSTHHDNGTT